MSEEQVVELMRSSKSEAEWNANCDRVKLAQLAIDGRDYPSFWYRAIMASGLRGEVANKFKS